MKVREYESLGHKLVEREYSDEEILDLFPDGDGSLVNPLLRRAQRAEDDIKQLRTAINSIKITTVRTVPIHMEGPYPEAGLEQVLVGDWDLISKLQTGEI